MQHWILCTLYTCNIPLSKDSAAAQGWQRQKAKDQEGSSRPWFKGVHQIRGGWKDWSRLCQFDVVINHTMRQGFLLSYFSEIGCLPNTNNNFLLKVGLSVSTLDMAWMFSPPFTTHTASLNKSWLIVLPFPNFHSFLPPKVARTCILLSSLGFCWVFSGCYSTLVKLRATWLHFSRVLETSPFTSFPSFK